MRRFLALLLVAPAAAALAVADVRDARACGGCFHPPPSPTETESVVTDHRMVFSVSTTQTVLWDQIKYTGNPSQFAWVLPIHPGARLELSHDAFISALDATTQTTVTGPTPNCPGSNFSGGGGGGCAFGGAASADETFAPGTAPPDFDGGSGVQVINQAVVGPYETVTVRASMGDTLDAWLIANGFAIQPNVEPTIAAYASAGFDFIALKLAPGEGVGAMQPVRVVTPGSDATLPLRMIAAGVGAHVGIDLWIISEGRYHTQNFPDAVVDFSKLTWDPYQNRSNYSELEAAALAAGGGTGWVTEYSQPMPLDSTQHDLFVALYGTACVPDFQTTPCGGVDAGSMGVDAPQPDNGDAGDAGDAGDDASTDEGGAGGDASTADAESDAAPASDASSTDAAPPPVDAAPPPLPVDAGVCGVPVSVDACDDPKVAFEFLHASDIWITRLRADLPASALPQGDLSLEANPAQISVSSAHTTAKYSVAGYNPCPGNSGSNGDGGCACRTTQDADSGPSGVWAILVAFGLVAARVTGKIVTKGRAARR